MKLDQIIKGNQYIKEYQVCFRPYTIRNGAGIDFDTEGEYFINIWICDDANKISLFNSMKSFRFNKELLKEIESTNAVRIG